VDGGECEWGRVLVFEPPERLVLAWQITGEWRYDPDFLTEVEVRFIPEAEERTCVELEHRDLEALRRASRGVRKTFDSPDGWDGLLNRFARAAAD
jgi:uncharacterized protein YndB with AHSA1/START domain